ncbi:MULTISPECIES: hypothetical protein [Saccharothrix]|uniref:hypothetical protein n=1 Tax=Saccharothrix TaxID=2071 RepID=UPI0009391045|nr:hypothetical protein [Saccharothrix sp. CB00851]OKI23215.1 hypothetical protein A6A25_35415 [Saccharothrix sp. CB00851]
MTQPTFLLGTGRPSLALDDLPEPEEVFRVRRLGPRQVVQFVVGPSLIALGISIGSGEWLLGPQAVGQYGFIGVGWVILVSAVLQTCYNVEISRYVVATGEVPVVGWGRVPPGWKFWVPFSLLLFYFAFIFGGWAAGAGQGLFALITGRVHQPNEVEWVRLLAIGLLVVVFLITLTARFEALVRNFTDAVHATSPRLRKLVEGDPRRFCYPFMLLVLAVIAGALHLALPVELVQISANMSNLGALIFPFALMYLNSKLPRPARPRPWHYVLLVLNVLFFGFFFVNFAYEFITGTALVRF